MEVKITIPSKLSEITLRQYKAFLKVQEVETNDKILNAQIIRIFCSVPMETVMLLKLQDVNDITKTIYDLLEQKPALVSKFKLNGNQYGFIPQLDEMSFGEYIDLDTFIGDWDKMEKAMNVLYRPILVSLKDKYSIEDYNIDTSEDLIDMPMDAVLGAIFFFLEFRNRLIDSYDELFGGGTSRSLDGTTNFGRKWGWYQSIYGLSQGDIRRFEDITKLNVHKCFMMLSFMKDKNELEAKQIKNKFK